MNTSTLAQIVAQRLKISERKAKFLVKAFFEEMAEALARGERIELRGFGSFEVRLQKSRVFRHPQSGQKIVLPPRPKVIFKPSKLWSS